MPISNSDSVWDERQIISSLTEIGYKWRDIRRTIEIVKTRKNEFFDLNSIISECLKTISQNNFA
ncbi:hypothetical protein [Mycoplasma ovis]|uniref:hypothetical protein n=1 Tax=Mycoplasma ovis TaxID=171632 RepID=UPI0004004D0F|nr:hypothetical protein [Mycoplasma ovis]